MDYYIYFRNIIKNNILFVFYISIFIISFLSLVAVVFYTKDSYIYVLAIYISLGNIIYIFKYRPSLLHSEYIVNRITANIIFYGLLCLLGLLYLIFCDYPCVNFISNSNFQWIRLGVLSCACVFFIINFIYMPWSKDNLTYIIFKLSYVIFTLSFTSLCGILFIVFFAPLILDLDSYILKMNYQGPGGNPNSGGNPGLNGNSGPGENPGPPGNPGPGGNPDRAGDSDSGILNPSPNLATITAKVEWRWNNGYRSLGIFSPVPVGNYFNSNFTIQEITFLSNKVRDLGLDNTRPFGVLRWQDGDRRGIYRVVRLRNDQEYPDVRSSDVRPSGEFRAFLDSLS